MSSMQLSSGAKWLIGILSGIILLLLVGYGWFFYVAFDDLADAFWEESAYSDTAFSFSKADDNNEEVESDYYEPGIDALAACSGDTIVPIVPIYGDIVWGIAETDVSVYGNSVAEVLRTIEEDPYYAGAILTIDSPGGYPVAGFRIAEQIARSEKPIVAVINDIGASAAYIVAASTDRIFVHPVSDVGGIGVTASYLSEVRQNELAGLEYEQLSSARFKDAGWAAKELTEEERELFQSQIDDVHVYLVKEMAAYRNMSVQNMAFLSDGRTYLGNTAVTNGLADELGGVPEAIDWIRSMVGEEITTCYTPAL